MRQLSTLSGKCFKYKGNLNEELIIYTSDENGREQERFALVITPYTINLVKSVIMQKGKILMGASRDNPPQNSLGAVLKNERQTPQQLSYLIPILIESGFCEYSKKGKAFLINYIEKNR